MKRINQGWLGISYVIILMLLACSPIPYLELDYRLPTKSETLKGKRVSVAVEDARKNKNMIGAGARQDFENFSGNISFSVSRSSGARNKIGIYEAPALLKEAFIKRLENEGVEVVSGIDNGTPQVRIILQQFLLDLVDRKWTLKAAYEASLTKEGKVLATQIVSGEGERLKILGREQVDVLVGEVFSDLVNRVDLNRLFREQRL